MRFLASIPLAALLASVPASACPVTSVAMHPIAVKNVTMLPYGGVLLGVSNSFGNKQNGAFSLVDENGVAIATTEEPIAPGLVRLTPTQHADRELSLAEGGKALFPVQDAGGAPAIAIVPKIAKVTSTHSPKAKARLPYPLNETTTITLASAPPADVAGIVLYGSDGTARGWMRANQGRIYQLSFGGKGCGGVGMSGTIIGEDVMLAFVDNGGRVSAQTKAVRVGRTPPPPPPPKPPAPPVPTPPMLSKPTPPTKTPPTKAPPTKTAPTATTAPAAKTLTKTTPTPKT